MSDMTLRCLVTSSFDVCMYVCLYVRMYVAFISNVSCHALLAQTTT